MKTARDRMEMSATYNDVGSYRGAAAICGVDPKTVKKAVLSWETTGAPKRAGRDGSTTTTSLPSGWLRPRPVYRPSASCLRPGQPATAARPATSGAWWPGERGPGVTSTTGAGAQGCSPGRHEWLLPSPHRLERRAEQIFELSAHDSAFVAEGQRTPERYLLTGRSNPLSRRPISISEPCSDRPGGCDETPSSPGCPTRASTRTWGGALRTRPGLRGWRAAACWRHRCLSRPLVHYRPRHRGREAGGTLSTNGPIRTEQGIQGKKPRYWPASCRSVPRTWCGPLVPWSSHQRTFDRITMLPVRVGQSAARQVGLAAAHLTIAGPATGLYWPWAVAIEP